MSHNHATDQATDGAAAADTVAKRIKNHPRSALLIITLGALATAAATSVAAKTVFGQVSLFDTAKTASKTAVLTQPKYQVSTPQSARLLAQPVPKVTTTKNWVEVDTAKKIGNIRAADPVDCVHYACVGERLTFEQGGGDGGWSVFGDYQFDYVGTPIYLTEGGPLAPKDEPEHGESGYSNTYYGRVDPLGERTSLAGWKTVNGFDSVPYYYKDRARYINAYDLGFGRDMNCYGSSCYVTNYLDPKGVAGGPTKAATVAMERMYKFGRTFIAFFVFDAAGQRVNRIALDSEGAKSVPESCNACHKGYITPGGNPAGGSYLPWDLDLLEDWPGAGRPTVAAQLDTLRRLNKMVWSDANTSYSRANFSNPNDPSTFTGYTTEKRKQSLVDLIEGWYDGAPYSDTSFSSNGLPKNSWYSTLNNAGQIAYANGSPANCAVSPMPTVCQTYFYERSLYKNVYEPYCRACHVTHGQNQDTHPNSEGVEFPNASIFAAYAKAYACDRTSRPRMPHAELTDERFKNDVLNFTNGTSKTPEQVLCETDAP